MLVAEATEEVRASADTVLDFVMDIDRYRQADHKIRRVRWARRDGNELVVSMWTRARGVPSPAVQRMRLTPGERIDVFNEPSWQDRLVDFHGEFECRPTPGGVRVTHRYTFVFKGPGRIAERLLGRWLQQDIEQEVHRLRSVVEASGDRSTSSRSAGATLLRRRRRRGRRDGA